MGIIVVLIIITVVVIAITKAFASTHNGTSTGDEGCENEEYYEVISEFEKQQLLLVGGEELLTFTLDQYQQAINGKAVAMSALGAIYWSKLDIPYKAAFWFGKADRFGDWEGTYWYGQCLRRGYGVEEDGHLGMCYILRAAKHGNETAIDMLRQKLSVEEMRSYGIPV